VAIKIRQTSNAGDPDWLVLRAEFFPEDFPGEHQQFLEKWAARQEGFTAFVASDENAGLLGFAEVAVRQDYVNGCQFQPALFLEGIFVREEHRGKGVARSLCEAAAVFGEQRGCREFASDVLIDDEQSLAAHAGLGFEETERVVYFRKLIKAGSTGK
jgi:aminoglycoside 6'-N-acetyltransferase I